MKKECIPIASCNPTYFGLDIGGWTLNVLGFAFVVSIVGFGYHLFGVLACQFFLNYFYVKVLLKLEENIGAVALCNNKVPTIIYGFSDNMVMQFERLEKGLEKLDKEESKEENAPDGTLPKS